MHIRVVKNLIWKCKWHIWDQEGSFEFKRFDSSGLRMQRHFWEHQKFNSKAYELRKFSVQRHIWEKMTWFQWIEDWRHIWKLKKAWFSRLRYKGIFESKRVSFSLRGID